MGVLGQIAGLLFARPYGKTMAEKAAIREVVRERTEGFGIPVVFNLDIGHTTPMLTLPLGCRARIESERGTVSIIDGAMHEG